MDLHKELFKDNWAVLSPTNHRVNNRKLRQTNRAEKRQNLYSQGRNLPSTPGLGVKFTAAASSTPMSKNSEYTETESEKENHTNVTEPQASEENKSVGSKTDSKLKRNEKLARREAHIQRFLTWKAQKIQQKELEKQKSKPPFIPVGKPKPNNQVAAEQSSFAPKNHVFQPPAGLKNPLLEDIKRQSIYLAVPTPPKVKALKDTNIIKLQDSNIKSKSARTLVKKINEETTKRKKHVAGNSIDSTSGGVVNIANASVPNELVKKVDNNMKGPEEPESGKCTTSKNSIQKGIVSTQKEKAAVKSVSIRHTEQKKPLKTESTSNKTATQKVQMSSLMKGTCQTTSAGAVGKARAMQERKKSNTVLSKEQNQRNNPKPKLSANLKAKKPANVGAKLLKIKCFNELRGNTVPTETPADTGNSENMVAFVTSTQMKTTSASTIPVSTLSKLCKSISPVQAPTTNKPEQSVSAKRRLLQEPVKKNIVKSRNFNFVKEALLDVTSVGSPLAMLTSKEAVNQQKTVELERKSISKTQPTPNGKNNLKLHTRIFQKMQLQFDEKATNRKSPMKIKSTPRRSLKPQTSNDQKTPQRNKKFNFLVKLKLDETAVESTGTENIYPKENIVNEKATQNPSTPENMPSTPLPEQPETPKGVANRTLRPMNYMSPFVSVSRGKVSARKEREKRNSIYLQETPTTTATPIKTVETPVEKRRALEAVRYFRQQLNDEIQRLHAICDKWDSYKEEHLDFLQANSGEDMINVTTGQTRLLTSKKFMQFNGLINRCEAHANGTALVDDGSEATKTITAVDLEGFWSMLTLQVENVEKRFQNLERFKANNWEDPDAVELNPRVRNNLIKLKKSKTNIASKPRGNTALRQMMRKKMAEMRAQKEDDICYTKTEEVHFLTKNQNSVVSPRHLRTPTLNDGTKVKRLSKSPGRICVVVPDRKSHSLARTVISVPSPVRSSPKFTTQNSSVKVKDTESENLLRTTLRRCNRRSRSLPRQTTLNTPSPIKSDPINSPPHTPKSTATIWTGRKSILKTPGTAKKQSRRSVVFNNHLSVKKFRPLQYDDDRHIVDVEYDAVQQVHIDDFVKMRQAPESSTVHNSDKSADEERSYRLRNRRVKLRPSCEIELPK